MGVHCALNPCTTKIDAYLYVGTICVQQALNVPDFVMRVTIYHETCIGVMLRIRIRIRIRTFICGQNAKNVLYIGSMNNKNGCVCLPIP